MKTDSAGAALEKERARLQEQTTAMNEALMLSSVHQHELTQTAEKLNAQLRAEIAERKQAEAALRESEQRYRTLFELGPVAVYSCDVSGEIRDFNRTAVEMWGRKPKPGDTGERFCGSLKLYRPDGSFIPHEQCPMAEVLSGNTPEVRDREVQIERPDGSRITVLVNIRPLKDERGGISGAINCFVDITEREHTERARTILATIVESSEDAITSNDLDGIVTSWNRGAERLFGYSAREVIGQPLTMLIPADLIDEEAGILERIRRGESIENYETIRRRKDGVSLDISLTVSPIADARGRIVGASKIARDVTGRKRIETALKEATAAAKHANRAKSDFLSNMSHELRTPLNGILGFAQLIEAGSPPPTDSQKRSIEQILKAGWYLLELINEILDLALVESGKLILAQEPVPLAEVMLECRAMIEMQAQKRGIGVTFPRFGIPCFVKGDRIRIKQVLVNLLSNAIKYNRPEGTVAVEVVLSSPGSIRIDVRDTGVGLTPERLGQLFEPFNRLGKEASAEEGTGIGMVVTKRLVELMGGTIGADSTVGVGSVFWIEMSLAAAPLLAVREAGQAVPVRPQLPDGTPLRTLLYVEDNPANLELIEQLVACRPELRLLSATDADLGIECARAHQPEVILMDINLPGISGIEALKILRADRSTAHIPIIALSANAMPADIERALGAGFLDYITKPIEIDRFMDALDSAFEFSLTASARAASGRAPEEEQA